MTAAAYNLQRISKMWIKVISSKIYLIGWNESKLNGRKSNELKTSQRSLNEPKSTQTSLNELRTVEMSLNERKAKMGLNKPKWAQKSLNISKIILNDLKIGLNELK